MNIKTTMSQLVTIQLSMLLTVAPLIAIGEDMSMTFSTAKNISQSVVKTHCNNALYKVIILKNAVGLIGGYMLQPTIMDARISYLDSNGDVLASFHLFDSNDKKAAATNIINQLAKEFPLQEVMECN